MQVAAAEEVMVADHVVAVAVAAAEDVEERQVYVITDMVAVQVTMVAMMLGAIMAKPVEKERSATEMVPLAGTSVADSAAEGHIRSRTMAAKTETARRCCLLPCRRGY
jgi:nucleoside-diphosphate-sugar epimerase